MENPFSLSDSNLVVLYFQIYFHNSFADLELSGVHPSA